MSKYIKVDDAIETAINGCASWDGGYFPSMDDSIKEEFDAVADKCIDVVRCKDCKHRHKADDFPPFKSGYYCDLFHIKSEMKNCDDWFCADGEVKSE